MPCRHCLGLTLQVPLAPDSGLYSCPRCRKTTRVEVRDEAGDCRVRTERIPGAL